MSLLDPVQHPVTSCPRWILSNTDGWIMLMVEPASTSAIIGIPFASILWYNFPDNLYSKLRLDPGLLLTKLRLGSGHSFYNIQCPNPSRLAAPRWCGSSALTNTAEWHLHPDWQCPGDVVPPLWPSQLNGISTQTGNAQVMWFLRSDHHSWMVFPPRLVTPRWCGSSALTVTAEWPLHPDWQCPGDVVPLLWPSQLNGISTQTGNAQVMWFLRSDQHCWMASPPRLAMPRWCGSSALTITAEWHLHPDWQCPGDVVPPLWPSQLNGLPT